MKKEVEDLLKSLNYREEEELRQFLIQDMIKGSELLGRKLFWEWFLIFMSALDIYGLYYDSNLDLESIPPIHFSGITDMQCTQILKQGIFFYFLVGLASMQKKKNAYTSLEWGDEIIFRYKDKFFKYKSRFMSDGDVHVDIYRYDEWINDKTDYADLNKVFKNEYSKIKPSQIEAYHRDKLISSGIDLIGAVLLFITVLAFVITHFL